MKFWLLAAAGILVIGYATCDAFRSQYLDERVDRRAVFEDIYNKKKWGANVDGEGHSGSGSTPEATGIYRSFLQGFLSRNKITSVVDAGCGDWQFSRNIDWSGINYRGYDIVESIVSRNSKEYGAPNIHFYVCDIVNTELPPADLLIVKDVLQHLANRDIRKVLKQFPKYKHVLVTNDAVSILGNSDTVTGGYRPLDLRRSPFNMPMKMILTWKSDPFEKVVLYQSQSSENRDLGQQR